MTRLGEGGETKGGNKGRVTHQWGDRSGRASRKAGKGGTPTNVKEPKGKRGGGRERGDVTAHRGGPRGTGKGPKRRGKPTKNRKQKKKNKKARMTCASLLSASQRKPSAEKRKGSGSECNEEKGQWGRSPCMFRGGVSQQREEEEKASKKTLQESFLLGERRNTAEQEKKKLAGGNSMAKWSLAQAHNGAKMW